jgi:hypothetical protein
MAFLGKKVKPCWFGYLQVVVILIFGGFGRAAAVFGEIAVSELNSSDSSPYFGIF